MSRPDAPDTPAPGKEAKVWTLIVDLAHRIVGHHDENGKTDLCLQAVSMEMHTVPVVEQAAHEAALMALGLAELRLAAETQRAGNAEALYLQATNEKALLTVERSRLALRVEEAETILRQLSGDPMLPVSTAENITEFLNEPEQS